MRYGAEDTTTPAPCPQSPRSPGDLEAGVADGQADPSADQDLYSTCSSSLSISGGLESSHKYSLRLTQQCPVIAAERAVVLTRVAGIGRA